MTHARAARLSAIGLAAFMTLAMLAGIGELAALEPVAGASAAAAAASAVKPAA